MGRNGGWVMKAPRSSVATRTTLKRDVGCLFCASQAGAARQGRQLLASRRIRQHRLAILGEKIHVVVAIVAAGVDRKRGAIHQLPDLDVVQRRERHRRRTPLGAHGGGEHAERGARTRAEPLRSILSSTPTSS